jgi:hypothetical protein
MENDAGEKKDVLSPQEEMAKAAILAECDKLAKAGVTFAAVHFDGYGDDGATEEVKCFDNEYYVCDVFRFSQALAGGTSIPQPRMLLFESRLPTMPHTSSRRSATLFCRNPQK